MHVVFYPFIWLDQNAIILMSCFGSFFSLVFLTNQMKQQYLDSKFLNL
jgi:hypothetical protein